jgi:hypothetical protein
LRQFIAKSITFAKLTYAKQSTAQSSPAMHPFAGLNPIQPLQGFSRLRAICTKIRKS